ncbi:response regulator transcription factor [Gorillibacterium sp. sgz5001074]|uniref:response regulator transcription factor n=1 Tax=Gorillibacterium sp. sgz5001074 TaxID=3446695 RepID=UPI003F668574
MNRIKVLVVDDEWNMRNLLRIYLTRKGMEVKEATNGQEALEQLRNAAYDLILLDVMMPDMDGWEVCRKIREKDMTPILMLTARTEVKDKVQGLGLGADDYLTKPFDPDELIARVYALLRRSAYQQQHMVTEERLEAPGMIIYPEGRQVHVDQQPVELTQKEFDLFLLLARSPHRAFSREILVEALWGHDYLGDSRVVDTHIKNIREKIQRAGLSYNPIQTVWGVGYKFQSQGEAT